MKDAKTVVADFLEGSANDHDHRQHGQYAEEGSQKLAKDVAIQQRHELVAVDMELTDKPAIIPAIR